jgi:hypothetical protein
MLMDEQKQRIETLCVALESGEYKQGQMELRNGDSYCCLGVACDLYLRSKNLAWEKTENFSYACLRRTAYLASDVREWYGFESENPSLGDYPSDYCNDVLEMTFPEIAALFRNKYLQENPLGHEEAEINGK